MIINKNISENLKLLRMKQNLTQTELAHKLDISRQSLSNYEKGLRNPDILTLSKFSKFFNCSLDFIVFNITDANQMYKCFESKELDNLNKNIINFLESKKRELALIKNSINDKMSELDSIIESVKEK